MMNSTENAKLMTVKYEIFSGKLGGSVCHTYCWASCTPAAAAAAAGEVEAQSLTDVQGSGPVDAKL